MNKKRVKIKVRKVEVESPGGKVSDVPPTKELIKVSVPDYAYALDKSNPFFKRLKKFLLAENKAGRQAKVIKDFILLFLPWGRQIGTVSDFLALIIKQTKQKEDKQMSNQEQKPWYQSKTIIGAVVVLITIGANYFGVEVTEAELQETITAIIAAAGGILAIWGRISAEKKISTN